MTLLFFLFLFFFLSFFFQAEDGIRDLVRSRGLGDVYKRQVPFLVAHDDFQQLVHAGCPLAFGGQGLGLAEAGVEVALVPVSYTHLTLPTSDLV